MPKKLEIYNIGTKGLNTDLSPWDLPAEFITNGFNFKVFTNSMLTTGGYELWTTCPTDFNAGFNLPVYSDGGNYWLVAGRSAVYAFDGTTWGDISSVAGYAGLGVGDELSWSGGMLGQIPIIHNPQHYPEYWNPVGIGSVLKPLPWSAGVTWDDRNITAQVIRTHNNFLFALNLTDGATSQPDSYRWSTAADINGLPYTWDETDTAGLAGIASLGGDGGKIIDGLSLRDSFCIYSERAIDILDFTGGEFVWRRRELDKSIGLLSRDCVVEVKGSHYFISNGDIYKNDGAQVSSILKGKLQRQFSRSIEPTKFDRCFAAKNESSKEIWFCIPSIGADYADTVYAYNWEDDSWAIRDLPPSTVFSAFGPNVVAGQSWDSAAGNWDDQNSIWNGENVNPLENSMIGLTADCALMKLEPQNIRTSGPLSSMIERTDFPLEGFDVATTITRVYPHIRGVQPVQMQFGSQQFPGGPITWKDQSTFTPGIDRKVDIRTTGTLHCWRISSINEGNWEFSGMDIEYEYAGKR